MEKVSDKVEDEKDSRLVKKYYVWAIRISLLLFILSLILFLFNDKSKFQFSNEINYEKFAAFGTFAASLIGLVISLVTVFLIYKAYEAQKKELAATVTELAETKKLSEKQTNTLTLQQFENTFFKLIDNHSRLIRNFDSTNSNELGEFMSDVTGYQKLDFIAERLEKNLTIKFNADYKLQYQNWYEIHYKPQNDPDFKLDIVNLICRDISEIITYINSAKVLNEDTRLFYSSILFNSLFSSEKFLWSANELLNGDMEISIAEAVEGSHMQKFYDVFESRFKQDELNNFSKHLVLFSIGFQKDNLMDLVKEFFCQFKELNKFNINFCIKMDKGFIFKINNAFLTYDKKSTPINILDDDHSENYTLKYFKVRDYLNTLIFNDNLDDILTFVNDPSPNKTAKVKDRETNQVLYEMSKAGKNLKLSFSIEFFNREFKIELDLFVTIPHGDGIFQISFT